MFFHFSEEQVSSFLFSCICFKYFLLLALVSEFNCFLRSRCSMEMWCPDDIGRDSWDWVGPPASGRACFNSPEWGGGSSPVKTEPPQIVNCCCVCCVCCVCCEESLNVCMVTAPKSANHAHPAAQHLRANSRRQRQPPALEHSHL